MYTEEELQEMCIGDLIALILELQETVDILENLIENK
jgi:hypothetical protein